jgi:hypothetical protein
MDTRKRAFHAALGGLFCATLGSLLAGLVVVLIRVGHGNKESLAEGLAFFPLAAVFAAIPAAPFGFVVGTVGSWWLVARGSSDPGRKRLYFEAAGIGAALGATFPLILTAFGWGPFDNLVSALPISIGIGAVCGVTLTLLVQKRLALG